MVNMMKSRAAGRSVTSGTSSRRTSARLAQAPAESSVVRRTSGATRFVQLFDVLDLLFGLHPPVLEPDLDLAFGEAESVRDLDASLAGEVSVELELFLEFERLVARVCLAATASLR